MIEAINNCFHNFSVLIRGWRHLSDRFREKRCAIDNLQHCVNVNPLVGKLKPQNDGSLCSNTVIGTLAVDGWAVTLHLVHRGGD